MNVKQFFYFPLIVLCVLSSCNKDNDDDIARPVSLQLSLSATEGDFVFDVAEADVKITNTTTGSTLSAEPDEDNIITFESLTPGNYSASATLVVSASEYTSVTGIATDEDVYFNGSIENLDVFENTETTLDLIVGRVGSWVFKQIYYAGSNASQGAGIFDTFIEIYNNSNQVMYADSLYFGQVEGKNNNKEGEYYLSNYQYDWSKSIDMTTAAGLDANTDYIYAYNVFMIPSDGTGKKYPVNPGESFVIASNALNFKAPYTDNDGNSKTVQDPSLTVDLSGADFETNLIEYLGGDAYRYDIDNSEVPNVDVVYSAGRNDMVMQANGRDAYYLFKAEAGQIAAASLPLYAQPQIREITTTTSKFVQIPVSYIEDAVEIQHPIEASRVPRRLPTALDAVRTFVPAGQYTSQSLVRKTLKTVNGRRILKDTNNSSEDFGHLERADPSKSASSFID